MSNLRRLTAATKKTLESKICEAGRDRVAPKVVGEVVNAMAAEGELDRHVHAHGMESYSLAGTPLDVLAARRTELDGLLAAFRRHASGVAGQAGLLGRAGVIGQAGEDMLGRAFAASPTMEALQWGDTSVFRGKTLTQPSDGLVIACQPVQGYKTTDLLALVEVKNRRDWPYPENYMPWKLARNAYEFDVVGIYFSRRIPKTTFWYVFKSVGAVGIETFNQFAPPDSEAALSPVRHKFGLGFHDLYFREDVPTYLQRQVDNLPDRITAARDRMNEVRYIVEEYLDDLADKQVTDPRRRELFDELHGRLKEHDRAKRAEEEEDSDDEDRGGGDGYDDDQYDGDDRFDEWYDGVRDSENNR